MSNDRKRHPETRSDSSRTSSSVTAGGLGTPAHLRPPPVVGGWPASSLLAAPMAAITLTTTPVFEATTRVLVGEDPQRIGLDAGSRRAPQPWSTRRRRPRWSAAARLARKVVESLKLWEAPEYAPLVATAPDDAARAAGLVDPFLSHVTVALIPDSRVVSVSVEAAGPGAGGARRQ